MSWILVVEDNRDICDLLGLLLAAEGHRVVTRDDGDDALAWCAKIIPDLILLDVALAGATNGLDVARRLRSDEVFDSVPIVLLTARAHQDDVAAGYEAGADTYLVKPFRAESLLDVVRQALAV